MRGEVMGGDYYCRICGQVHTSAIIHGELGRVQKIQMKIEALENAIDRLMLTADTRKEIELRLNNLKKSLKVDKEKIFLKEDAEKSEIMDKAIKSVIGPMIKRGELPKSAIKKSKGEPKYSCNRRLRDVSYKKIKKIIEKAPMSRPQQEWIGRIIKDLEEIF